MFTLPSRPTIISAIQCDLPDFQLQIHTPVRLTPPRARKPGAGLCRPQSDPAAQALSHPDPARPTRRSCVLTPATRRPRVTSAPRTAATELLFQTDTPDPQQLLGEPDRRELLFGTMAATDLSPGFHRTPVQWHFSSPL